MLYMHLLLLVMNNWLRWFKGHYELYPREGRREGKWGEINWRTGEQYVLYTLEARTTPKN